MVEKCFTKWQVGNVSEWKGLGKAAFTWVRASRPRSLPSYSGHSRIWTKKPIFMATTVGARQNLVI